MKEHGAQLLKQLIDKLHMLPDEMDEEKMESPHEMAMEISHPEMELSESEDKPLIEHAKVVGEKPMARESEHSMKPKAAVIKVTEVSADKPEMYHPAEEEDYKKHPMFQKLAMKKKA